jgi:outer membrane lipoprotein
MRRFLKSLAVLFFLILLSGCAHVISQQLREKADPTLTFREVFDNPDFFKGKYIVWGGEIIQTINRKDGTTLLEVFQRPVGWRGEPKETLASEGRFLVSFEKYLDPYIFRRGREITVAGEIQGERIRPLGEMDYRYPFILGREIYLWEEDYYYPYPYYYSPYPWWGYPYGWRFGIIHHRHR